MQAVNVCKSYFSGFQEVFNYKKDHKCNALALLKIISYLTILIPLGFAAVYGAASLRNRAGRRIEPGTPARNSQRESCAGRPVDGEARRSRAASRPSRIR